MQQINARRKYFNDRADINKAGTKIQGMDELFYGKLDMLLYYIKHLGPKSNEDLIEILKLLGRNDLIDGIKNGKIQVEWSE